jgi:hypothetical protein
MPSQEKIKIIQSTLDNFAVGLLNFAKKRITVPCEHGGMGLFDVENFLCGQQAGWVIKAKKTSRDNWRTSLRSHCYGNVLCAGPDLFTPAQNPILYTISKSYSRFRQHHDLLHCNFTQAIVINNPVFNRGAHDKNPLNFSYLELDENSNNRVAHLRAWEFFNVNGLKTKLELQIEYGIILTVNAYGRLASCLNNYVRKLRPNNRNNGSSRTMDTEFLNLKNPGKKIRAWFTKKKNLAFDIKKAKFFVTFQSLTQVAVPNKGILENRISMWNRNGLNNRIRTFVFKFYNNLLGLNTRLSHFVIDQSRQCAFCTGTPVPVPDETFLHLFFDCPVTRNWHDSFLSKYVILPAEINRIQRLQLFFLGILPNSTKDNLFLAFSIILFQFCIWEEKLRKKKPSFNTIENIYLDYLHSLLECNKKILLSSELINIPLCRIVGANNAPRLRIPAPAVPRRHLPP